MTAVERGDLVVIGAGAAGLATAIFAARAAPEARIVCVDGARRIGAKILVSGGSRCNVTNRIVTERDFWGAERRLVRNVLRAFPADRAAAFFESLGVALHEEEDGKLFPDSNQSRSVLDALLSEAARRRVDIRANARVGELLRDSDGFAVCTPGGTIRARAVALATGGRSLPKTGSDGFGYQLARALGHGYVDTTPALAPLILDGNDHAALAGVALPVALTLRLDGRVVTRLEGPMLWTHFGASGPVALNMSRHWERARLDGLEPVVTVSVLPDETFESIEAWWRDQERARPRARISTILSTRLPAAVADAWIRRAGIAGDLTLAHVSRDERRRLGRELVDAPLAIRATRGYSYAEVTAGGIPLAEIDTATMQSKTCEGLFLVGEVLDVDGRLGGFNFQWAWSSGWVAGHAVARMLTR